ncbi:hypothetical protein Q4595_16280 [Wenyingzhuangia sp. 1_MG-2023]|nr:hypothetical protein [Wenyingzhuangia sp. 1_MG-2023]
MELDIFITKTINSVVKGVADSQNESKEKGACVNPVMRAYGNHKPTITNLEFDIAITSSSETENQINGGISVVNISLGGKSSDKDIEKSISKVKFSVPIILPETGFDLKN